MRALLIATIIAAGCATSSFAAGGGGGGSPAYVIDSRLLLDGHGKPHVTIEQVKYVWANWYQSNYDKLDREERQLTPIDDFASQAKITVIQTKKQRMRENFARKLRNHNVLVTPQQAQEIASDCATKASTSCLL